MSDRSYAQDFLEISQVKARYCRFLDTKDWAGYTDLFTEDVEFDLPPEGQPPIRGRDVAMRTIRSFVETAITAHQVHNAEIRIEGDVAHVIWAMQDRVIWGPERANMQESGHTGYGHYFERYVRKDGRWRIAAQKLRYLVYDSYPRA